jgi:hypothetical protein
VWSAPCTWRREARVSWFVEPQNQGGNVFLRFGLKTGGNGFLRFGLKTSGDDFSRFGLKTGSYGLVIWASKSARQFLDLHLKIKQVLVCRLHHKIDGGGTTRDTRRDLAAYFTWKQVMLGFSNLASRLAEAQRRVVHMTPS